MVIVSVALMIRLTTLAYHVTNGCPVPPSLVNTSCSTHCCCTVDQKNRTAARCNIREMSPTSMEQIQLPRDLFSLDLSSNGLEKVPRFLHKLPNISVLSLANNSMNNSELSLQTLENLENLRTLNVSHTGLWTFQMKQSNQILSSLENVFVWQSHLADPSLWDKLLALPNIRRVIGVKWARACDQCNISKIDGHNAVQKSLDYNGTVKGQERYRKVQQKEQHVAKQRMFYAAGSNGSDASGNICSYEYQTHLNWETYYVSPRRYLRPGFVLQCDCNSNDCVSKQGFDSLSNLLHLLRHFFSSLYFIATVAIILNLAIIFVVLTSGRLPKSPTIILIFNMTVCDLLMSVYCILIAHFNELSNADNLAPLFFSGDIFASKDLKQLCRSKVFIFTVAQNVAAINSLFLTVEKYLVIVYPLKPGRRMTKKIALICLCVTWLSSIAYSIDAVYNLSDEEEIYNFVLFNHFYCSVSGHHIHQVPMIIGGEELKNPIPLSVFLGVVYAFLFLCTIPLYIHIFIVVKKSSTQIGIRREGVLARKLALLVFTNVLFSVVPLSLAPVASGRGLLILDVFKPLAKSYSSFMAFLICFVWLPILLLCLNSCLNPFIFAFRHHRFQMEFRHIAQKITENFRK